ncbi:MAG: hypothetical protein K6D97_00830 [Clostridia bacterium]|nr:hypothetical protein [Clostridia bacterium]
MSKKNTLIDDIGFYAFLYTFKIPIIILFILFILGYFKFAAPINKEYDEKMTHWKLDIIYVYSATTGEKLYYEDINPMRTEIARSIDNEGHILPEKKDRVQVLSDELIVNILGCRYNIEEVNDEGKIYYNYYIDDIRTKDKEDTANLIEMRVLSQYDEAKNKDTNIEQNQ